MGLICYKNSVNKESSVAKTKISFYCNACGSELSKWAGQCPDCKAWNTVEEFRQTAVSGVARKTGYAGNSNQQVTQLAEVSEQKIARIEIGINDLPVSSIIKPIDRYF